MAKFQVFPLLTTVVVAACFILACSSDIERIETDQHGQAYVTTSNGEKWMVYRDDKTNKHYFYNQVTNQATWIDPRRLLETLEQPVVVMNEKPESSQVVTIATVATLPIFLVIAVAAARISYLHMYYPDLLFPTKERKERRQKSSRFRPQKARGKMSQDGKGGRSANS
ncbi:hypothetical protein CEUSTIGMA_g5561.t1 [Chlamydomonas eustigma]|uniref:WW domain-containing protein n=1 Tax=Chlamydomonas eustigma TaxID=1157962 RepID=A0A250X5C4_9CHLO|nr:hypothetical protein CEUSTIGMA_g5561.t1 [Chlamydomonas eustigma]|eukprot:GAX78119.1 hypothetical protein CEUSTIGMA_g5561.t1 [Chlamydomonas eustigma]